MYLDFSVNKDVNLFEAMFKRTEFYASVSKSEWSSGKIRGRIVLYESKHDKMTVRFQTFTEQRHERCVYSGNIGNNAAKTIVISEMGVFSNVLV